MSKYSSSFDYDDITLPEELEKYYPVEDISKTPNSRKTNCLLSCCLLFYLTLFTVFMLYVGLYLFEYYNKVEINCKNCSKSENITNFTNYTIM